MSEDEDDYLKEALDAARRADAERTSAAAGTKRKRNTSAIAVSTAAVSARARLLSGLSTAIGSDNKGFSLLRKAGWNPGQGVGHGGTGLVEPVSVSLRRPDDRAGIGGVPSVGLGLEGIPSSAGYADGASALPTGTPGMDDAEWANALALRNALAGAQRSLAAACKQLRALVTARLDESQQREMSAADWDIDDILCDATGKAAQAYVRAHHDADAAVPAHYSSGEPVICRSSDASAGCTVELAPKAQSRPQITHARWLLLFSASPVGRLSTSSPTHERIVLLLFLLR